MFLFASSAQRRLVCSLKVRIDGSLHSINGVFARISKDGKGQKFFVRFSLGIGLHPDGTPYNACLVIDVPVKSDADASVLIAPRVDAEIMALSSFDINKAGPLKRKPSIGDPDKFARTWLSIAASFAYQIGCTHLVLEDAANVRREDGALQLISQLTLLSSGKTLYEKYNFQPDEPLHDVFRTVADLKVDKLSKEAQGQLATVVKMPPNATVGNVFKVLNDHIRKKTPGLTANSVHKAAHAVYESVLPEHFFETQAYGLVRHYSFKLSKNDLSGPCVEFYKEIDASNIYGILDKAVFDHLKKYNIDKLDVVVL
jgi:hypothetical protein